ncbi:hypothetical protein GCM10027180_02390 [Microbulbifer echini]
MGAVLKPGLPKSKNKRKSVRGTTELSKNSSWYIFGEFYYRIPASGIRYSAISNTASPEEFLYLQ